MSISRNLTVTAALAAIGGVVGAVMGVLGLGLITLATAVGLTHEGPVGLFGTPTLFAATFGAGVGAVLAPIAAWSLMRHVPLWKAILQTTGGTTLGVIVGYFSTPLLHLGLIAPIIFGVAGFLGAAVRLRLTKPQKAGALES
ncbi:MAG TPA: hypothetical protein VH559_01485 [Gemmatimonadaceae bacterium]